MTYVLILVTTLSTIGAQLLLKHGLRSFPGNAVADKVGFLLYAAGTPWVWAALALQVIGYLVWFFVIAQEKLGIAFAISGSFFYLIMAFMSWALFGERLSLTQWGGLVMISGGVILLARA